MFSFRVGHIQSESSQGQGRGGCFLFCICFIEHIICSIDNFIIFIHVPSFPIWLIKALKHDHQFDGFWDPCFKDLYWFCAVSKLMTGFLKTCLNLKHTVTSIETGARKAPTLIIVFQICWILPKQHEWQLWYVNETNQSKDKKNALPPSMAQVGFRLNMINSQWTIIKIRINVAWSYKDHHLIKLWLVINQIMSYGAPV